MTEDATTGAAATSEVPPIVRAERHLAAGELDEARRIGEALHRAEPQRAEPLYLLGLVAARAERIEEAHDLLARALALQPGAPRLRHDMASLCVRMGRIAEAEAHLHLLIETNPDDAGTYEHLALIQKRAGRTDEAIASFRRALAADPRALGPHQALGGLLYEQGDLEDALGHLRAVRDTPHGTDPYQMLGLTLLGLGFTEELADLSPRQARTAGQRFNETILRALAAWQAGDFATCRQRLDEAAPFARIPDQAPNRRVFTTYFDYVRRLLELRRLSFELYDDAAPAGEVYAVGDSHCMMAGHTLIPIGGAPHRVVPRLVFGCKAFHLISPQPNPFRASFEAALARLPRGARMIAVLGEIDLRYKEGIMRFLRKAPQADPEATATRLAAGYVGRLLGYANAHGLDLIVMSPPASNVRRRRIPEAERATFDLVIRSFNRQLRDSAAAARLPLIDLYGATTDENGATIAEHYVDTNHVRPGIFVEAARAARL